MSIKLLLVEDEAILALATSKTLENHGFSVISAHSGEKAVETVDTDPGISLVLMDIDLGKGIDGTEAAERILKIRALPIVFLTSHSEKDYVDKVKEITKYGYVLKNSGKFVLLEAIHMAFTLFEAKQEALRHLERSRNAYTELEKREKRLEHLNRILLTIRNVNQLITKETDIAALADKTCELLIETSGYHNAWISFFEDNSPAPPFYHAGYGASFKNMDDFLRSGGIPQCAVHSIQSRSITVIMDPVSECIACPFQDYINTFIGPNEDIVTMSTSLFVGDTVYGWLNVTLPAKFAEINTEQSLFREIAQDLSYAIHNLKAEETKNQLLHELNLTQTTLMTALDNSHAGIAIANAPDGKLRYVNNAGLMIRGGTREEIVEGVGIENYVSSWQIMDLDGRPLEPDEVPLARAVMYGEVNSREFIVRREDEEDRIVTANAAPIFDENGKVESAMVIFLDVTEYRLIEKELLNSERNYRTLWQTAPIGIFRTTVEGEILELNPAITRMIGAESAEQVKDYYTDLSTQVYVDSSKRGEFIQQLKEKGFVENFDIEIYKLNGEKRWFTMNAQLNDNKGCGVIDGFIIDSTDYKEAMQNITQLHSRLQKIVDNSPFLINEIDANGRYILVNNKSAEVIGKRKDEIIGRRLHELLPEKTAEIIKTRVDQVLYSREQLTVDDEVENNNHTQTFRTVLFPISSDTAAATTVVGIGYEITDQIKSAQEKDFLMKELNHRIKNNLNMINSLIALKSTESGEDFSDIYSQIEATRLVHEKLNESNNIMAIQLKSYLYELLETVFNSFSGRAVHIIEDVDDISIPSRMALPIGLIVNELATNAIKHGFSSESEPRFSISLHKEKDCCFMEVSNSGNPFPDHIDIENANSLGLKLVQSLIAQLEGSIKLTQRKPNPVFRIQISADAINQP